jgi:hypothetical protein
VCKKCDVQINIYQLSSTPTVLNKFPEYIPREQVNPVIDSSSMNIVALFPESNKFDSSLVPSLNCKVILLHSYSGQSGISR